MLGAIPGATPDKWVSRWRDRFPELALEVRHFDDVGQLERIRRGTVDLGYVRVTEGRVEERAGERVEETTASQDPAFHRVWLYREDPVVCAARDHWVAAAEESVDWEEIRGENLLNLQEMPDGPASSDAEPHTEPDVHTALSGRDLARTERTALEVAASGAGLLILPHSMARMLAPKDVVIRRVEGLAGYDVGLAWLREQDSDVIQEFIGIARGRKPGSGRTALSAEPRSTSAAGRAASGRQRRRPQPGSRRGRPPRGQRRRW